MRGSQMTSARWPARGKGPDRHVFDLQARSLDPARDLVIRPRSTDREQHASRPQDPADRTPHFLRREHIPPLAEDLVRRIADDSIDG